jgi:NAD(P)-dependent dehydrogenase (short-subunit alcohol dehydrogenase family)
MDIKGKVAIVSGSSSGTGVGGEIAKLLGTRGCNVVVNYANNQAGAEEAVTSCKAGGADAFAFKADVTNDADCRNLVAAAIERWGHIDFLVNNAATTRAIPDKDLEAMSADEFHRIYSTNLIGCFHMTRAAAPHLKATGNGAVVNISSVAGLTGGGSSIAYAASKAALNTLTLSFARVLAPEVRVNAICPGGLLGNWTRKILSEEAYEAKVRGQKTEFPLGRAIWPVDVAETALWLIEGASTMTGELIRMDSGKHLL